MYIQHMCTITGVYSIDVYMCRSAGVIQVYIQDMYDMCTITGVYPIDIYMCRSAGVIEHSRYIWITHGRNVH